MLAQDEFELSMTGEMEVNPTLLHVQARRSTAYPIGRAFAAGFRSADHQDRPVG